ncbi:MAG: hypothetical protein WCI39_11800 [Gallionellaceae bacterium]
MGSPTLAATVEQLSQELVDLTRSIKTSEQRVAEIKRLIVSNWSGSPIQCLGGKVLLVQAGEFSTLDQEALIQLIFERSMLSTSDAKALINDSKVERQRGCLCFGSS